MVINPKNDFQKPIIFGKTAVLPGEETDVKIRVGKLPSNTPINLEGKIYRSKNPGPTILVIGGVHGDEVNGIQIVRKAIINEVFGQLKKGSVIVVPLLNIFGFINFSREVPDGKDINRSFPGFKKGSLASRVAYTLTNDILPYVDIIIDYHTGGNFRYNFPQIRYNQKDKQAAELASAFSPKFIIHKPFINKSLRKIAYQKNIPTIVYEGGESVRLDGHAIEAGLLGMKNVLAHLEMINHHAVKREDTILCTKSSWVRSSASGIFIWSKRSGNYVQKGEPLGTIGDPYGNRIVKVIARKSGYLIGHNNASVVNQGDALFHLAYEYEKL